FTAVDGRPIPQPGIAIDGLSGVRESQIAQLARGRYEVRVVPGAGFDERAVNITIHRNIERLFGAGQQVTLRIMPRIPRSESGKLKSVVVKSDSYPLNLAR